MEKYAQKDPVAKRSRKNLFKIYTTHYKWYQVSKPSLSYIPVLLYSVQRMYASPSKMGQIQYFSPLGFKFLGT